MKQAFALECREAVTLIASGECTEGITAFLGRKPPEFPDMEGDA